METGDTTKTFALAGANRKGFMAAFWSVYDAEYTNKEQKANCELTTRTAKSKGIWFGSRNMNTETTVTVPIIQNTKAIKRSRVSSRYSAKKGGGKEDEA